MARIMICLEREEIQKDIPYALICETVYGSRWNTGKRRREWADTFAERERVACNMLAKMAYDWALRKGAPERIVMSVKTYDLWQRLGAFCASL